MSPGIIRNSPLRRAWPEIASSNSGKTLVAVKVFDSFLEINPRSTILFIVHDRELVAQQANYISQTMSSVKGCVVKEIKIVDVAGWDKQQWDVCRKSYNVLVGIHEVFRVCLESAHLNTQDLSLCIFDECHNAIGNSPVAKIAEAFRGTSSLVQHRPHILGLTASFVPGKVDGKDEVDMREIMKTFEFVLAAERY